MHVKTNASCKLRGSRTFNGLMTSHMNDTCRPSIWEELILEYAQQTKELGVTLVEKRKRRKSLSQEESQYLSLQRVLF